MVRTWSGQHAQDNEAPEVESSDNLAWPGKTSQCSGFHGGIEPESAKHNPSDWDLMSISELPHDAGFVVRLEEWGKYTRKLFMQCDWLT